jgi:hypothetical protein
MTTTEDLLREALHARADRTTYDPTPVADVASRARFEQRRQRRSRALVAAAAVAAVALPVGIVLGTGPDSAPEPAGPVEESVTVRIDSLADLEQGAPPAIDHVEDTTYVFASGERLDLPVADGSVIDAAPYQGSVLFATSEPGVGSVAPTLTLLDRDGTVRWERCGSGDLAVSADRTSSGFAWLAGDCDQSWSRPRIEWGPAHADGPVLDGPLVEGSLEPGQRLQPVEVADDRMLYNVSDPTNSQRPHVELALGRTGRSPVPGLFEAYAYDASAGLVAGCSRDDGRCRLVDHYDGAPQLTLPEDEYPLAFSPDGRHLVTTQGGREAPPGVLLVRDVESGDLVVRMDGSNAFLATDSALAWEDDEHLLFGRVDREGEALVRLGLDGSLELATRVEEPTLGGYLLPGS